MTGLWGDGRKKGVVLGPEAPGPDLGRGPALVKLFGGQQGKEQEDQGDPMAKYTSVLHQLLRHIPRDEFRAIVERHQGDKGVRKLSCWGQFVAPFFRAVNRTA